MMSNPTPAWVKPALEFGPLMIFLLVYMRIKERVFDIGGTEYSGFIIATALFVPLILVSTGILWRISGKLPVMQVFSAVLVLLLGGLTIWLNDPQFIKMKPTFLYIFFATLLAGGLLAGRNLLNIVMGGALKLRHEGWRVLTWRFVGLMLAMAAANEVVWRNFSEQSWVYFKIFGLPLLLIGFMLLQAGLITRYAEEEENPQPPAA